MLRKETNQEEKFAHHFDVQIHELYAIICLGAQNSKVKRKKKQLTRMWPKTISNDSMQRKKGKKTDWVKTTEKQGLYEVPHFATIERPGKEEAVYEM